MKALKSEHWCYKTQRQVKVEGLIVEKRQAEVFLVQKCEHADCPFLRSVDCLVGRKFEGRWG